MKKLIIVLVSFFFVNIVEAQVVLQALEGGVDEVEEESGYGLYRAFYVTFPFPKFRLEMEVEHDGYGEKAICRDEKRGPDGRIIPGEYKDYDRCGLSYYGGYVDSGAKNRMTAVASKLVTVIDGRDYVAIPNYNYNVGGYWNLSRYSPPDLDGYIDVVITERFHLTGSEDPADDRNCYITRYYRITPAPDFPNYSRETNPLAPENLIGKLRVYYNNIEGYWDFVALNGYAINPTTNDDGEHEVRDCY